MAANSPRLAESRVGQRTWWPNSVCGSRGGNAGPSCIPAHLEQRVSVEAVYSAATPASVKMTIEAR